MVTETDFQYRVLQNSLSRFSIVLNKADNLPDIGDCLQQNAKYLCNFSLCRFHYFHEKEHICYVLTKKEAEVIRGTEDSFCSRESGVFADGVPYYEVYQESDLETGPANGSEIWIWKFNYSDKAGILVKVISEGASRFSKQQAPIIKIVSEMLYTKTRMVLLLEELRQKGEDLLRSNKNLEESNTIISNILSKQEKTIEDRTQAVMKLNAKLVELIQFNSHNIREPLTRIMGLMSLYELDTPEDFFNQYWPMLENAVHDMDQTIRTVISNTENLDKYEDFFN